MINQNEFIMLRNQSEDQYNKIGELKEEHVRMQTALGYTPEGMKTGNGIVGSLENVNAKVDRFEHKLEMYQEENRAKLKSIEKIVWITTGIITTLITILQILPPLKELLAI